MMVQAYLRGVLSPRYDQGNRSILRENLIIHTLGCEEDMKIVDSRMRMDASMLPGLSEQSATKTLKNLSEFYEMYVSLVRLWAKSDKHKPKTAVDMIQTYNKLKESGALKEHAEIVRQELIKEGYLKE